MSAIIEYIEDDEDIKNKNQEIEEDIEVEPDSENESVYQQGESKTKGKDPKLSILDNPFQYIKPNKHIIFSSMIYSENPKEQLQSIKYFRRILSNENPPVQAVIQSGVVPTLLCFLDISLPLEFQLEACWAVTNILSGDTEHVQYVLDLGLLPKLVLLLYSRDEGLLSQIIWAIGNIAGDDRARDRLIQQEGLIDNIVRLDDIIDDHEDEFYQNFIWAIFNICRGKPNPNPPFEKVSVFLPILTRCIKIGNRDTLTDAGDALAAILDTRHELESVIQTVIDTGVIPDIIHLLNTTPSSGLPPFLSAFVQIVGGVAVGTTAHNQYLLDHGAISPLVKLLNASKANIRQEACWAISNFTAGPTEHIQFLIDHRPQIFPILRNLLSSNLEAIVRNEAIWAIMNVGEHADSDQIQYLMTCGCLAGIIPALTTIYPVKSTINHVIGELHTMGTKIQNIPDAFETFKEILLSTGIEPFLDELSVDHQKKRDDLRNLLELPMHN